MLCSNRLSYIFGEAEARWTLDIHVQPASVAIVAGSRPAAFDPTVRESLELAASGAGERASCDVRLQSLGLLPGVAAAARLSTLSWTQRVELDFLQAWLQRPEWLVFDAVFDHPDAASVAHLPRLFHHRFPLRAMSFVGRARPDLPGCGDQRCSSLSATRFASAGCSASLQAFGRCARSQAA